MLPSADSAELMSQEERVVELLGTLKDAFATVRESWKEESRKMKAYYDRTHKNVEFKVGQYVVLYRPSGGKLQRKWRGVYRVTKVESEVSCEVRHIDTGEVTRAHVQRLKHYEMGEPIVERQRLRDAKVPEPAVGEPVVVRAEPDDAEDIAPTQVLSQSQPDAALAVEICLRSCRNTTSS